MDRERSWDNLDELIETAFREVGNQIATILPDLVGAFLVVVVGLLIANTVGQLIATLLRSARVDSLITSNPLGQKLDVFPQRKFVPSRLVGWLVKWFLILVTLITAANIMGWTALNDFLRSVALYIPNVVIAVLILVIGFIASNFVRRVIETGTGTAPLSPAERRFLAVGSDTAITVFAVMAALTQLKIAETLVQTLFTGIIFALSLALGLAFGLGGREHASRLLSRYSERVERPGQSGGGPAI